MWSNNCHTEYDQAGNPTRSVGTVQDVTERHEAEKQIRLMARVFESSGEAILITDRHNKVITCNQAFSGLTGYQQEEIIGRNPNFLSANSENLLKYQEIESALTEAGYWQGEILDRRKDGGTYPKWCTATAVLDSVIATNRRQSLYRIHLLNATFFSVIIVITQGSQMVLADMYALGLIASFCINMFSLIVYRYFMGTKEVAQFHTSRSVTLLIWIIFMSFFFLASMKPHGTMMWATVTGFVLLAGVGVAKKRSPEIKEIEKTDSEMSMILYLAQSVHPEIHIFFRRPREELLCEGGPKEDKVFVIFFSPRKGIPPKCAVNEFRLPIGEWKTSYR